MLFSSFPNLPAFCSGIASLCGGRCYQFWFLPRMWDDYQAPRLRGCSADVLLLSSLAIKCWNADRCEEKSDSRSLEVDAKLDAKVAASWINWNRAEHGWVHDPHTWVNVLQRFTTNDSVHVFAASSDNADCIQDKSPVQRMRCPASQDRSFRFDIQMLGCLDRSLSAFNPRILNAWGAGLLFAISMLFPVYSWFSKFFYSFLNLFPSEKFSTAGSDCKAGAGTWGMMANRIPDFTL